MLAFVVTDMAETMQTTIEKVAGVSSAPCLQCNKCTAGCPIVSAMDLTPAQIVHLLRLGREEKVLKSHSIWACLACQTCTARCPQDVDVDKLLTAARIVAMQQGILPEKREMYNFILSYMENLYLYGRLGEIPLLLTLKLKEQNFFDDFVLGLQLLTRGRLNLVDLPHGGDTYRELYKKTREKERESS